MFVVDLIDILCCFVELLEVGGLWVWWMYCLYSAASGTIK